MRFLPTPFPSWLNFFPDVSKFPARSATFVFLFAQLIPTDLRLFTSNIISSELSPLPLSAPASVTCPTMICFTEPTAYASPHPSKFVIHIYVTITWWIKWQFSVLQSPESYLLLFILAFPLSLSAYPTISILVSTKLPVCASGVITSVHTLIHDHRKWEGKQNNTVEKCFKNHWAGQINVELYSLSRNLTWKFKFGGFGDSSVGENLVIQAWESGFRPTELIWKSWLQNYMSVIPD